MARPGRKVRLDRVKPPRYATEAAWQRLREHMEWADRGWIGFVFAVDPGQARELEGRLEDFLRQRAKVLRVFRPKEPVEIAELLPRMLLAVDAGESLWIEGLELDPGEEGTGPWQEAWTSLMLRTNEKRDVLRRQAGVAVVFVAPPQLKPWIRDAAPDLWSARAIAVDVGAEWRAGLGAALAAPGIDIAGLGLTDVPDLEIALADVERLERDPGGSAEDRAQAHLRLASALLDVQQGHQAIEHARRAVEILPDDAPELASAEAVLGAAELAIGDLASAKIHFHAALDSEVLEPSVGIRVRLDLAGICTQVGEWKASRAIYDQLVELARLRGDRALEAGSLEMSGRMALMDGGIDLAESLLRKATSLTRLMVRHHFGRGIQLHAHALQGLAAVMMAAGHISEARSAAEEGLTTLSVPSPNDMDDVVLHAQLLSLLLHTTIDDTTDASRTELELRHDIETIEEALRSGAAPDDTVPMFIETLREFATWMRRRSRPRDALEVAQAAEFFARDLLDRHPAFSHACLLALVLEEAGNAHAALEDHESALRYYREREQVLAQIRRTQPNETWSESLRLVRLEFIAEIFKDECWTEAPALARSIIADAQDSRIAADIADCLVLLSPALLLARERDLALEATTISVSLSRALSSHEQDRSALERLHRALYYAAGIYGETEREDDAAVAFAEAIAIAESLAARDDAGPSDIERLRDLQEHLEDEVDDNDED
ncbi:hypothetical protein [Paraliomyxa miuraensis]|uniref:hypothetical protein n=1 Tax=Paraliomyxa miuraensis TaxID=376150 RepID=UPI00224F82B0|nr:hypothetical protein [Paraliomyxa miuraensis]MCX4243707.1 hypothetical protein [Paraliomyxa miuraensis]